MRFLIFIVLALSLLFAQKREALLIGNSHYKYIDNLQNPIPSLRRLKRTLENLGFNVENIKQDLSSAKLFETIEKFSEKLARDKDTIGFVYYSGHGCQLNYQGYLVPIDVDTKNRVKIKHHALSVNELLETLSMANNRVNMVFLDACRDVPVGTRGGKKGLGQPTATPKGSLVVYATEAGKTADDNSNFINALITNIQKPNQDIKEVADSISNSVADKTNENQIPVVFYKRLPKVVLKGEYMSPKPQPTHSMKGITIVDGLMYQNQKITKQDDKNYWDNKLSERVQTWQGAINYCNNLTLGRYSNWRLPTNKELRKLITKTIHKTASGHNRYIKEEFAKNLQKGSVFWTSTVKNFANSWGVCFKDSYNYWYNKLNKKYVLCVR